MKKRIISVVTAVCLVFSLMCIGVGNANKPETLTAGNVELTKGEFNIIIPEGMSREDFSIPVYEVMKQWPNVKVYCSDDATDNGTAEIIIGNCNRPETIEALKLLNSQGKGYSSDYIIYEKNGNIVIVGNSDAATKQAVQRFVTLCLSTGVVERGMAYTSLAAADAYSTLTINGRVVDGNYHFVTPKHNMSYLVQLEYEKLDAAILNNFGYDLFRYDDRDINSLVQGDLWWFDTNYYKSEEYFYEDNTFGDCQTENEYNDYYMRYTALDKSVLPSDYAYEIVIGECYRNGCPAITDEEQYVIKVSGNKVYLNGGSPYATAMAVSEFRKMVESGDVNLTDDSSVVGNYYTALKDYNRDEMYTLSWGDDFNGTAIDESLWTIAYDSTHVYSSGLNGRTPQRASKTLNNNYVKDGCLYMDALYDDNYYYGGHLSSAYTMRMNYGYVEISCKKPLGQGFWSTLWVDNDYMNTSGLARLEVDVCENYGPAHLALQNVLIWPTANGISKLESKYGITGWTQGVNSFSKNNIYRMKDNTGFDNGLHTFGYAWDENTMTFTVDGNVSFTYNYATDGLQYSSSTDENMKAAEIEFAKDAASCPNTYLRLSLAVGFATRSYIVPDGSVEWTDSNQFIVDYVHVYQTAGQSMKYLTSKYNKGDTTGDGVVDAMDATYIAKYIAKEPGYDFKHMDLGAADIDGNGVVNNNDLTLINEYLVGKNTLCG